MAIDFSKPVTTDIYTGVVTTIRDAHSALAQWLDPAVAGTLTSTPTGAYRLNAGAVQRFNGTSWVSQEINGINFAGGNVGVGRAPVAIGAYTTLDLFKAAGAVAAVSSTSVTGELAVDESTAAMYVGSRTNHMVSFRTNVIERMRITAAGSVQIGSSSGVAYGLLLYKNGADAAAYVRQDGAGSLQEWATAGGVLATLGANGRLGIGATAPSTLLELRGDGATLTANTTVSTSWSGMRVTSGATETGSVQMQPNSGEMRYTAGFAGWGGYHRFYANGLDACRIDTAASFHANGQVRATGWAASQGSHNGLGLEIGVSGGTGWMLSYNRGASTYGAINIQGTAIQLLNAASVVGLAQNSAAVATYGGLEIGFRDIPRITSFADQRGKCIATSAGVTINTSDIAAGYAYSIYNDSAAAITITQGSGVTLRQAGTTATGNRTLAARGLATIWANSGAEAIISGSGIS